MFASVGQRQQVFGYVMQEETLVDVLTVREALAFSASLRGTCSRNDIAFSVEAMMAELGLDHVADSRIGSVKTFRGISGGEKKRVAIGMELMAGPPVLLLDEPTTGLDAAAAAAVMRTLTNLVKRRRTLVICTLHQPRAEIFQSFGKVLLLRPLSVDVAVDSNVVLCTPPKNCRNILLSSATSASSSSAIIRSTLDTRTGVNVADILLDLVAAGHSFDEYGIDGRVGVFGVVNDATNNNDDDLGNVPRIRRSSFDVEEPGMDNQIGDMAGETRTQLCCTSVLRWMVTCLGEGKSAVTSYLCCTSAHAMTPWELSHGSRRRGGDGSSMDARCYRACGCWWHFGVLLRLEATRIVRSPASLLVHAFVGVFMGIFMGFLYANMQPDTDGVWNRLMGLFSITSLFALLGLSAIGTWQDDRLRFLRERASGYYGTIPYYLSKWMVDAVALRFLPVCLFVMCSYALVGWSVRFETAFVNSDAFYNASGCNGPVGNAGTCGKDPLAVDGDDFGAWGRSWWLQIMSFSLAALSSANIASFVSAFTASARVANFATVLIILFCLMFSGALVSISSMGGALKFFSSMSPFAFTLEAINIGTFQNQCFLFNPTTMESLFSGSKKALACTEVPGCESL
jgi:ABC-type iron transport system FetAB ATPase subunit